MIETYHNLGHKVRIKCENNVWSPYSAFYLAETAFPVVARRLNGKRNPSIIDVGTGSGILAILAGKYFRPSFVCVTDLNPNAVGNALNNWWRLNGLPAKIIHGITEDGIGDQVRAVANEISGFDIIIANLPQQPLVNDLNELLKLRETSPSAWNIDPTKDPDGLGIFISVVGNSPLIMKSGGLGIFSASSKQNVSRWQEFLNELVVNRQIKGWEIISQKPFNIPSDYDPRLIEYWLQRQKEDGITRLFLGSNGQWQYYHYNLLLEY